MTDTLLTKEVCHRRKQEGAVSARVYKYGNHLTPGLAEVRATLRS